MELQEKTLQCRECQASFIFTAGEQGFYIEKGLLNEPQRCAACRASRRRERAGGNGREATTITCASCGNEATVPFVPRYDRPVYCGNCFSEQKARTVVGSR